jgi:gas vesicle protein
MKRILLALAGGLLIGAVAAVQAKLPLAPPKSEADKKAEADKAAATKAKDAELLNKAMDKAVANYKKKQGASASPASMSGKKK